jgi:AcrR family transcriptional regulator
MNDRKRQILETAERLLVHYGVRKTTIGDIAEAAQIGVGTIYIEFSSKDALLEELAARKHRRVLERMRDVVEGEGDYDARLRALLEARQDCLEEMSGGGMHASELLYCGECDAVVRAWEDFQRRQRELLSNFLLEARRASAFSFDDADGAARTIMRALAPFAPPHADDLSDEQCSTQRRLLVDWIVEGLRQR